VDVINRDSDLTWNYRSRLLIILYEVCSKSSQNEGMEQQCVTHVRCCLSDLAT
jgi:hypothetical protein